MRSQLLAVLVLVGLSQALPTMNSHARRAQRSASRRSSTPPLTLRWLLDYFSRTPPSATDAFAHALIAGDALNWAKRDGVVNPKSRRAVAVAAAQTGFERRVVRRASPVVLDAPVHDAHSTLFTFASSQSRSASPSAHLHAHSSSSASAAAGPSGYATMTVELPQTTVVAFIAAPTPTPASASAFVPMSLADASPVASASVAAIEKYRRDVLVQAQLLDAEVEYEDCILGVDDGCEPIPEGVYPHIDSQE